MAVAVAPITDQDAAAVGAFLTEHLNPRIAPATWVRAIDVPWAVDRPNAGFLLRDRETGAVLGAHLAFYSEREIDGRPERFCNLGAFCVHPDHRFHAVRLIKALLAQDGYHFTDLSPSGSVVKLNERMRFEHLDTATSFVPNLPWPTLPGRTRIVTDPQKIEQALSGEALKLYRDHASLDAARHVVLQRGDRACYVVFRKDRRKDLPVFASVLHVSDPELFHSSSRALSRHLLLRHGVLATLVEDRVAGRRPAASVALKQPRRKMFRSTHLQASQIDYFYSELVCLPW